MRPIYLCWIADRTTVPFRRQQAMVCPSRAPHSLAFVYALPVFVPLARRCVEAPAFRVKFDDDTPVQRGPYTRGTVHGLDDEAFERLPRARRLQLSLLQPQGPELTFDFDVTGAASAINAILCER